MMINNIMTNIITIIIVAIVLTSIIIVITGARLQASRGESVGCLS